METDTLPRAPDPIRLRWQVVLLLAIGAAFAWPFDISLAQFFLSDPFPGELRSLIHKAEFFGHAYGILGIAFTIYLLSEHRRKQLPRLLSTAFLAGISCDLVKMTIHRVRPVDFTFAPGESTFLGLSFAHVESFKQIFDSSYHSFPSAHTATSVAFAMALGFMFPKAARWFLCLAALVAVSRFDGGAHYVSDTFVGAIVGYVAGCWLLGDTALGSWFERFERSNRIVLPWPGTASVSARYGSGPRLRRGATKGASSLQPEIRYHPDSRNRTAAGVSQ